MVSWKDILFGSYEKNLIKQGIMIKTTDTRMLLFLAEVFEKRKKLKKIEDLLAIYHKHKIKWMERI